jgi:hypothetical protein
MNPAAPVTNISDKNLPAFDRGSEHRRGSTFGQCAKYAFLAVPLPPDAGCLTGLGFCG